MNCRPGDLAMLVGLSDSTGLIRQAMRQCLGRVVRVTHLRPPRSSDCSAELVWHFELPLVVELSGYTIQFDGAGDAVLRPLRDTDGEDEVLRLAKPRPAEMRVEPLPGENL